MHDPFLPPRARTSARPGHPANGQVSAVAWTQTVRTAARNTGLPDPIVELFARQQKDLKHALERAEFAERVKTNFLAHMSHEFRTPLNAVIGFSALIRSGACDDPQSIRDYAAAIEGAGHQLYAMLTSILELAALDAENVVLAEETIDLPSMLGCAIESATSWAKETGVTVSADIPAGLPRLRGDRQRMRQVFDQVLSNAVKFTPDGGEVLVTAEHGAALTIGIADTGIGMAAGAADRVLTAFECVDGLRAREHGGVGIGLPLAARLVELHGGRLSIDSAPGRGTRISITLPQDRLVPASDGF